MIIIPFLLYHAGLLIGKICITFSFGVIFAVIGAALLHITRISVDIIHKFCILIKKNLTVFLFILYLILFIDIVYLIVGEVQNTLLKNIELHI
jgi:membrane associated rhomboid family serine protease